MTVHTAPACALSDVGVCENCGLPIGWVTLPGRRKRPVDVDPHRVGEYVLLRDGKSVISLRDRQLSAEYERFADRWPDRVFIDHARTCAPRGRHVASGLRHHR